MEMEQEQGQEQTKYRDKSLQGFSFWKAARRKFPVDDFFFSAGNIDRELLAKQISLDIAEDETVFIGCLKEETSWNLICPIVGCGSKLKRLADMETHYVQRHMAACNVCSNVFPSTRLLHLHLSETHDSFFQAKVARGFPMGQQYECFLEDCRGRFLSDARRLQHLVDMHQFPSSFFFHSKKHLSQDKRYSVKQNDEYQVLSQKKSLGAMPGNQKSNRDRVTTVPPSEHKIQQQEQDSCDIVGQTNVAAINTLTAAVSRLSTPSISRNDTPAVVSFGHRRT